MEHTSFWGILDPAFSKEMTVDIILFYLKDRKN